MNMSKSTELRMGSDVRKLVKALTRQGFEVARTRSNHHLEVRKDGTRVALMSGTSGDRREIANTVARCRRAGFAWAH
jgi:predicted RNA binding protein YcfA (HicA-like mRNA interferase family)